MDAVEFLREKERMCESFGTTCVGCPMYSVSEEAGYRCGLFVKNCPEQSVAIVEKWSNNHHVVTNLMKFEEIFGKSISNVMALISWWSKEYKEPKGEQK